MALTATSCGESISSCSLMVSFCSTVPYMACGTGTPVTLVDSHDHRHHVGGDQDDVLRHLGPGDGAHAAEERTDQDAGQTDEYADLEFEPVSGW
jgi:hypothetical protein